MASSPISLLLCEPIVESRESIGAMDAIMSAGGALEAGALSVVFDASTCGAGGDGFEFVDAVFGRE